VVWYEAILVDDVLVVVVDDEDEDEDRPSNPLGPRVIPFTSRVLNKKLK
jgi:hypothetical protein